MKIMKYIKLYESYMNPEFYKWFGSSKTIKNGNPIIFYHGVGKYGKFDKFDIDFLGASSGNRGHYGEGFYFAPTYKDAKVFSEFFGGTGEVIEAYLRIEKPFIANRKNIIKLGEKYRLNIPNREKVGIEKKDLLNQLKRYDKISASFLELIIDVGNKKAWEIFIDKKSDIIDKTKIDLNTISDWSKFIYPDQKRGVDDWVEEDMDNYNIKPKFIYEYPEHINFAYLTNLGNSALDWTDVIKKEGYDGILCDNEIVVFYPNQIKSIDNNGSYSLIDDNIYK